MGLGARTLWALAIAGTLACGDDVPETTPAGGDGNARSGRLLEVVDARGPVAGARVHVPSDRTPIGRTDRAGRFRLEGTALEMSDARDRDLRRLMFGGSQVVVVAGEGLDAPAATVEVAAERPTPTRLKPPQVVRGRVLAGGEPVAGAQVSISAEEAVDAFDPFTPSRAQTRELWRWGCPELDVRIAEERVRTDTQGRFELHLRMDGAPLLTACAPGYTHLDQPQARARRNAEVRIELVELRTIRGRVATADGQPIAGARVEPYAEVAELMGEELRRSSEPTLVTDADGRFEHDFFRGWQRAFRITTPGGDEAFVRASAEDDLEVVF